MILKKIQKKSEKNEAGREGEKKNRFRIQHVHSPMLALPSFLFFVTPSCPLPQIYSEGTLTTWVAVTSSLSLSATASFG